MALADRLGFDKEPIRQRFEKAREGWADERELAKRAAKKFRLDHNRRLRRRRRKPLWRVRSGKLQQANRHRSLSQARLRVRSRSLHDLGMARFSLMMMHHTTAPGFSPGFTTSKAEHGRCYIIRVSFTGIPKTGN